MTRLRVVDVDSHFMEPLAWLQRSDPALERELRESLPPQGFTEIVFGEVIAQLPPSQQEALRGLLRPPGGAGLDDLLNDPALTPEEVERRLADRPLFRRLRPPGCVDAAERLAACDAQGVDVQLVNPTLALGTLQHVRRHRPQALARLVRAYNDWATGTLAGHTDRLVPVSLLHLGDPEEAVRELARVRERGSRAFLLPLYPVDGRSLGHVDHEPVWAAAVDLGMLPVMHVATGSVVFDPAWANSGRPEAAKNAFRLASSQNPQIPQLPLADLLYSGVFERHPELVVLCSEFGLSWVPGWLDKLGPVDRNGTPNIGILVGWDLPKPALEYVQQHVRFSPLRGQRPAELLRALGPDSVLFATDWPHPEGSAKAVEEMRAGLDADTQARFFGGEASRVLAL